MGYAWDNVWSFETARFKVTLDCTPEEDTDLSWDEDGEVTAKLDSGEYVNVTFRVRVTLDGHEVGVSYLGNSIYGDVRDFAREHVGLAAKSRRDGCNYGSYFPGMVSEAITEAREQVAKLQSVRVRDAA